MIQAAYLPALVQQMAHTLATKRHSAHRHIPIRCPIALSRQSSQQVIVALRTMSGIHATSYFVDGERSTNYVLVDTAIHAAKGNNR